MPVTIQGTIPYPPNADAAPINQLASDLQQMSQKMNGTAGDIQQIAGQAGGVWAGIALQAFQQHLQGRSETVQSTAKLINSAVTPLRTMAAAITTTSATYTAAATAENVARAGLPWTAAALAAAIAAEGAAVMAHQAAGVACGAAIGVIDATILAQAIKKIFGDDDAGDGATTDKAKAEAEMKAIFAKNGLDENGKPLPGTDLAKLAGTTDTVPGINPGATNGYVGGTTPQTGASTDTTAINAGGTNQFVNGTSPVNGSTDQVPIDAGTAGRTQQLEMPNTEGMTDAQRAAVYETYFRRQGFEISSLPNGEAAILGLRQETITTHDRGTGRYDDRIVVVTRTGDGYQVSEYRANTEPSAQYDARLGGSTVDGVRINNRSNNGEDANGDGVIDAGRIPEGSYTFERSTSTAGGHRVAQPTLRVVGEVMAERDINHDGLFNAADNGATASAGRSMVFHRGSPANTFSAGCQTFYDEPTYQRFYNGLPANQRRFTYVVQQVGTDL